MSSYHLQLEPNPMLANPGFLVEVHIISDHGSLPKKAWMYHNFSALVKRQGKVGLFGMSDYANFRQQLDAVLRTLDIEQVRDFMIDERQWSPGKPADPEFAMWMMIAGSSQLRGLHAQARAWLVSHGYEQEAQIFSRGDKQPGRGGTKRKRMK